MRIDSNDRIVTNLLAISHRGCIVEKQQVVEFERIAIREVLDGLVPNHQRTGTHSERDGILAGAERDYIVGPGVHDIVAAPERDRAICPGVNDIVAIPKRNRAVRPGGHGVIAIPKRNLAAGARLQNVITVAQGRVLLSPNSETVSLPSPSTTVFLLPESDTLSLPLPRVMKLPPFPPVMEYLPSPAATRFS